MAQARAVGDPESGSTFGRRSLGTGMSVIYDAPFSAMDKAKLTTIFLALLDIYEAIFIRGFVVFVAFSKNRPDTISLVVALAFACMHFPALKPQAL